MTLVPLTECCLCLGVDPKTLRLWLKAAQLSCCLHPTDARLKCLTFPQLQQVAHLHGRRLPEPAPEPVALPAGTPASEQGRSPVSPKPDEAAWHQHLRLLQQQVSTLQAQVTDLALLLVQTSFAPYSQPVTSPITAAASGPTRGKALTPRPVPPLPEPARPRSRALPLIQVRADGSVVAIAPSEGVLSLLPDSPEWFAWLSSLTAFTFEDHLDRFSATRKFRHGQRVQSWNVHRSLHGRSCTLYLGLTPTLTLARLHEMAAAVHARLTTP